MGIFNPLLRLLPWFVFGQGVFLSLAVSSRWNHRSNRFLGTFLFLLSLHGLIALAWQDPYRQSVPLLSVFFSGLPFLYGPLVYRYVWHSLYREWNGGWPFIIHALPAIANFTIYGGILLLVGRENYLDIASEVFKGNAPVYVRVIEYLKIFQGILYAFLIIRLLRHNRNALRRWAAEEQRMRWLLWLVFAFALTWVIVLVSALLLWSGRFPEDTGLGLIALQLLSFLVFFYIVAFFALRYPAVLNPREVREAIRQKLNLPEGFIEETLRRLKTAEADRFFLDTEVTLPSLSARLGLHPNALSFIINDNTDMGFREYLNSLRLQYFLDLISEADQESNGTFLEAALASGFASKTTFLRAFRGKFDTTPSDYLSNQR